MQCSYFDAGLCRSCTELETPYAVQLAAKHERAREALAGHREIEWREPVASAESAFRNKAKMVVTGTSDDPRLGILDRDQHGVDLRHCGLYSARMEALFPLLAEVVGRADLTPYDVGARRGELKYVLVTESPDGEFMVRFVLRSRDRVDALRAEVPHLLRAAPGIAVVSVNLQPEHKAVIEGDEEVVLTERDTLPMVVNGVRLHLRPNSFFQTNTEVAATLYDTARAWADERRPVSVLDLYCGVGGFALHLAARGRRVRGVEISADAVASARRSAAEAGVEAATFEAADATSMPDLDAADLVVVNPPRRGLGPDLAAALDAGRAETVLYSSCHVGSLARDLDSMASWTPVRAQVLDMFPHTGHFEVLTMLVRR